MAGRGGPEAVALRGGLGALEPTRTRESQNTQSLELRFCVLLTEGSAQRLVLSRS